MSMITPTTRTYWAYLAISEAEYSWCTSVNLQTFITEGATFRSIAATHGFSHH